MPHESCAWCDNPRPAVARRPGAGGPVWLCLGHCVEWDADAAATRPKSAFQRGFEAARKKLDEEPDAG